MCEVYPGPRCSHEMEKKVSTRSAALDKAVKRYGANSPEASLASVRLHTAEQEYQSTPKGIAELTAQAQSEPTEENVTKFRKAELTRQLQTSALNEINNKRFEAVVTLGAENETFLDAEEKRSILEAARENQERQALHNPLDTVEPVSNEEYMGYIEQLEDTLSKKYDNKMPFELKEQIENLKLMTPPDSVSFNAYKSYPKVLDKSKQSLNREITKIASIQGVNKNVAQAYYEGYRQQYANEFAGLPKTERPDPPNDWVRGETATSGYTQDPTSAFSPRDAASLYAVYRLRSDDNATPDFLKTSQNIASLELETVPAIKNKLDPKADTITGVSVVSFNNKGKEVSRYYQKVDDTAEPITGDTKKLSNVLPQVTSLLEGKTLLTQNNFYQHNWLQNHLQGYNSDKRATMIDTQDMSRKHLDLPSHNVKTILSSLQVTAQDNTPGGSAATTGLAYFEMRKYVRKTWNSKPARRDAPTLKTTPLSSRWDAIKFNPMYKK
jgi:hypothetical protein